MASMPTKLVLFLCVLLVTTSSRPPDSSFVVDAFSTVTVSQVRPSSHKTALYGCRRRRKHFADVSISQSSNELWDLTRESIKEFSTYREEKRRRRPLKILYTLGFLFTFPVGPLVFWTVRYRDSILQDLRLFPTSKNTSFDDTSSLSSTRTKAVDENTLQQSRQVDEALEKSKVAWQQVREDLTFNYELMRRLHHDTESLLEQALLETKDAQRSQQNSDLLQQKATLLSRIEQDRKQLTILEDSVWELQSRATELNAQLRGDHER